MTTSNFPNRLGLMLFTAALCLSTSLACADTRAEIAAATKKVEAVSNTGDAQALAALYTADAQFYPEGVEPLIGRAAIAKYFKGEFAADNFGTIRFTTLKVFISGATVTEVGSYDWGDKTGKSTDRGHYIVVYRKEDGVWKLYRDISTSSVPNSKMT
jgi:uncharacterized protein (TIGR02246 family)